MLSSAPVFFTSRRRFHPVTPRPSCRRRGGWWWRFLAGRTSGIRTCASGWRISPRTASGARRRWRRTACSPTGRDSRRGTRSSSSRAADRSCSSTKSAPARRNGGGCSRPQPITARPGARPGACPTASSGPSKINRCSSTTATSSRPPASKAMRSAGGFTSSAARTAVRAGRPRRWSSRTTTSKRFSPAS